MTSDTRVVRDPLYSGEPIAERCCTVLRLAPTFLRFGSFEIFKLADKNTGHCRANFPLFPPPLHAHLPEACAARLASTQ